MFTEELAFAILEAGKKDCSLAEEFGENGNLVLIKK